MPKLYQHKNHLAWRNHFHHGYPMKRLRPKTWFERQAGLQHTRAKRRQHWFSSHMEKTWYSWHCASWICSDMANNSRSSRRADLQNTLCPATVLKPYVIAEAPKFTKIQKRLLSAAPGHLVAAHWPGNARVIAGSFLAVHETTKTEQRMLSATPGNLVAAHQPGNATWWQASFLYWARSAS